ncbi:GGDEF domain-containing protein [Marivibrio halodurans]|uniref:GGDEF domain-containing protein n=1 Tax=Marivibrio halodurans TaxID=2039722 RepID=A0A8J7S304_9PROT|nr:GGDEF domain-containing protein [Marivibrio halodurans]MBP5855759.1 GGDEF domain-containing protein [Marivibrio halodurans]
MYPRISEDDNLLRQDRFIEQLQAGVRFAFQPIVTIQTGAVHGYEALLRNHEAVGASSIPELFDMAHALGVLHRADIVLRERAIADFSTLPAADRAMLFFNLDGRIFESPDYHPRRTIALLAHHGVSPHALCLELSERYDNASAKHLSETLRLCREHEYKLAIDDFGRGFSEMKMLYDHQPDFVKIDRYFISDIAHDSKKRLMVSTIVDLAHVLGTRVVAEGIETEAEFLACKTVGCDLAQGFFVARPTMALADLRADYPIVEEVNRRDRRRKANDATLVRDQLDIFHALHVDDSIDTMLDAFRTHKDQTIFPLLDPHGRPTGVIREYDLKELTYQKYGRDLLHNKAYARRLSHFAHRCPIADIKSPIEKILQIYALSETTDGILVTQDGNYLGFLTADRLVRLMNQKNLAAARDQNPLSNLPGNNSVSDYIAETLEREEGDCALLYFDFNDFKPFNDTYGFRQGDRAITLFADLLRKHFPDSDAFVGHVGGDDFFVGVPDRAREEIADRIRALLEAFRSDVESFYSLEHRESGGIVALDRTGRRQRFGLLKACCAVALLRDGAPRPSQDNLTKRFAALKKRAKRDPSGVVCEEVSNGGD